MSVPEATLNEDNSTVLGHNQIRFPRQIFVVEPKAETEPMKPFSNPQLGLSISGADLGHDLASPFFGNMIRHRLN
jgi:hypothetical protein